MMTTEDLDNYERMRLAGPILSWRQLGSLILQMEEHGFDLDQEAFVDIDGNAQAYVIGITDCQCEVTWGQEVRMEGVGTMVLHCIVDVAFEPCSEIPKPPISAGIAKDGQVVVYNPSGHEREFGWRVDDRPLGTKRPIVNGYRP